MKVSQIITQQKIRGQFINSQLLLISLVLFIIGSGSNILAQQWQGSSDIDSIIFRTGSVGIGTTSPLAQFHVIGSGVNTIFERSLNNVGAATNRFQKSRGTTTAKLSVITDDYLGSFQYWGYTADGNYHYGAILGSRVESVSSSDVAANFVFLTKDNNYNYAERMRITADGNVAIGTSDPQGYKLAVAGSAAFDGIVKATELEVLIDVWPDYVFDDSYKLKPLWQVEEFINKNKHLPDVPSESEITNGTLKVGEMNAILLQKIEELTLYLIEQDKKINKLSQENEALKVQFENIAK